MDALDIGRVSRMESVASAWKLKHRPSHYEYECQETLGEFQSLLQIYVLRCLLGKFSMRMFQNFDDIDVDTFRACRTNVTPNGTLVPKRIPINV